MNRELAVSRVADVIGWLARKFQVMRWMALSRKILHKTEELILSNRGLERWYLVLGGVAVGRGFEPLSDLYLFLAEILIYSSVLSLSWWTKPPRL
jgi:hypothetical protein